MVKNVNCSAMAFESVDGADISNVTFQRIDVNEARPLNLLSISCVGIDDSVSDQQVRNFIIESQKIPSDDSLS